MTAGPNSVCIAVPRVAFGTERFVGIGADALEVRIFAIGC